MSLKLYMVYIGGSAPNANIELHDIQFVVGGNIESTYEQLRKKWYGTAKGLHIDSYKQIKGADGFEIQIREHPQENENQLYFVNLGGYRKLHLPEYHEFGLFVGKSKKDVKSRALKSLLQDVEQQHKDDLIAIEDCLTVDGNKKYYIHLIPSTAKYDLKPDWFGYNVIGV